MYSLRTYEISMLLAKDLTVGKSNIIVIQCWIEVFHVPNYEDEE